MFVKQSFDDDCWVYEIKYLINRKKARQILHMVMILKVNTTFRRTDIFQGALTLAIRWKRH